MARKYYLIFILLSFVTASAQNNPYFLGEHYNDVTAVSYSPDGQFIVTGSWDGQIYVFVNDSIPEYYISFGDNTRKITSLAFSRDSRKLLAGCEDGKILLYSFPGNDTINGYIGLDTTFQFTKSEINEVYYGPGLRMIFAADAAGQLIVYDIEKRVNRNVKTEGPVQSFAISIDRMNYFVATSSNTSIIQYNIQGKEVRRFEGHSATVTGLEVTLDRKYLISASNDKSVKVWNLQTGKLEKNMDGHNWDITGLAVDPYSKYAVTCGIDGLVNIYSIEEGTLLSSFKNTNGRCTDVSLSSDLEQLVVGLQMSSVGDEGYGVNIWSTGLERPMTPQQKKALELMKQKEESKKAAEARKVSAAKATSPKTSTTKTEAAKDQKVIKKTDQVEISIDN